MTFKVGDFAWDITTNSVVIIEYISHADKTKYLVKNSEIGGFRFEDQLMISTRDLEGNPLPTTNEA